MMMQGDERRKYIRIFLPGGQVRLSSGPYMALVGKVLNVSVGGIRFSCESEFFLGDNINLEIDLQDGMKLDCMVSVIYVEKSKENGNKLVYGGRFVAMSEAQKTALGEHIIKMKADQDTFLKKKLSGE